MCYGKIDETGLFEPKSVVAIFGPQTMDHDIPGATGG